MVVSEKAYSSLREFIKTTILGVVCQDFLKANVCNRNSEYTLNHHRKAQDVAGKNLRRK